LQRLHVNLFFWFQLVGSIIWQLKMAKIPRRYSHFVFGVIQSGLTSAIAAAIASYPFLTQGIFLMHWLLSWLLSWILMLPVVVIAAPAIRKLTDLLTHEET
jgi:hypothetical protein